MTKPIKILDLQKSCLAVCDIIRHEFPDSYQMSQLGNERVFEENPRKFKENAMVTRRANLRIKPT